MKMLSGSLDETEKIAAKAAKIFRERKRAGALIVGLAGDLGSGKTTFTQALAREFGVVDDITSPTYVIMKKYATADKKYPNLIHIDAYRLNKSAELASLGWRNIANDPNNLILLEWPERVADILPKDRVTIRFSFISETEREIDI
ncbi:MAG: tRNA (adenosine(37)-N6)-threonylcarbamoyltransferase complex ATPase subunit type 1 TsaE [Patescibacteria group bacterium]|nr:tRNA (adenosine(37)-N6)-threonylcarbamoyltransferase complex ATPase subunit type 1 TsaE [Patescibacteria group bacterium]MDE1945767.1 tRNA (adenosine(37)-N6)-threonylcarbamoyltransferase complex ATPase subunit type 1 TsaE [Patescibacteria group bacterium]